MNSKKLWIWLIVVLTVLIGGAAFLFSNYHFTLEVTEIKEPQEEEEEIVEEDVFENQAQILYSERFDEINSDHRSWPIVNLWLKTVGKAPVLLADNLGKVGEYFSNARFMPDGKRVLIDLESKLMVLDLETKKLKDYFVATYGVQSYIYSPDEAYIWVFDQDYANPDTKFNIVKIEADSGEAEVLHEGDSDGDFYFFSAVRDDGLAVVMQAMGEAGHTKLLTLETGEIREIPGVEPALFGGVTSNGRYLLDVDEWVDNACGGLTGDSPSIWKILDPITGEVIDKMGQPGLQSYLEFNSDDESELVYSVMTVPKTYEECDQDQDVYYFSQIVGEGAQSAVEIDIEAKKAEYGLRNDHAFKMDYGEDGFKVLRGQEILFEALYGTNKAVQDMRVN